MNPGDYIDDYCSRCKRISDHAVVSMLAENVGKVRCRTCNNEHNFRNSQVPKRHAETPPPKRALGSSASDPTQD